MSYKRITKGNLCYSEWLQKGNSPSELYYFLKELEDKIENGTLVELPCKVGDVVYAFVFEIEPHIEQYSIIAIEIGRETYLRCFEAKRGLCYLRPTSIFLTKAEAEEKLKELSKNP